MALTYNPFMLDRTRAHALPVLNRSVDYVPAAQACCGACRTCVTTNVFTIAGAAIVASSAALFRLVAGRR
jgi:hypothetical protein